MFYGKLHFNTTSHTLNTHLNALYYVVYYLFSVISILLDIYYLISILVQTVHKISMFTQDILAIHRSS